MPKHIKSTKKIKKISSRVKLPTENFLPSVPITPIEPTKRSVRAFFTKVKPGYIIAVLAVILVLAFATNKGFVVAAIVNGKPIFRWTLSKTLMSKFGTQTLESMITEDLISQEAKKANITVSQIEIDAKEQEILTSFGGGVTLPDLLKFQGMTKEDLDSQVGLQLKITKLLGKDIAITDSDITDYISKNKDQLTATGEAELKTEARDAILNQKIGEKVQPWFTELRSKANILKFL